MATFNFGIGLQVEGNGAAGVAEFTAALNGLNAAFQQISGSAPDFSEFTGTIEGATESVEQNTNSIQETAEATQEAVDQYEELTGVIIDQEEEIEALANANQRLAQDSEETARYVQELEEEVESLGGTSRRVSKTMEVGFSKAFERLGTELDQAGAHAVTMLEAIANLVTFGGASKIEDDLVRMNAQMGQGRAGAKSMMDSVFDMSDAMKLPPELMSQTAQAIARTGGTFVGVGDAAQETAAKMVGVFRIDPNVVATSLASAKAMGASFVDLANESADFGATFNVPGLIEQLPGAIDFARSAQVQFAGSVKKSGKEITGNVQQMTAFYSKALGKDAVKAAEMAQATFSKFAGAVSKNEDVFLGLSDEFDPMTNAMLEAGLSFEEAQAMLAKPLDTPEGQLEFVKSIKDAENSMDPQAYRRYYKQMMANADEGTQYLMTLDADTLASAEKTAAAMSKHAEDTKDPATKAAEAQAVAFEKMSVSMRESVAGAAEKNQASMDLVVERLKMLTSDGVMGGLNSLSDIFSKIAGWVEKIGVEYGPQLDELTPIISGIVVAAGAGATAFSALGAVMAPLRALTSVVGGLGDAAALLPRLFGSTATAAEGAAVGSRSLTGALGASALAVGLVVAGAGPAAESMRELSDATLMTKDSGEQMGTIYGSVLQGALQTIDGLLGGLPSKLFGVTDGFGGVQTFVTDMFTNLPQKVEDGVAQFYGVITDPDNLLRVGKFFADIGNSILSAFMHLPAALMTMFQSFYNFATDIFGSIVKGVMKAFGASGSSIETVNLFLDYFKLGFEQVFGGVRQGFNAVVLSIAKGAAMMPFITDEQKKSLNAFVAEREAAIQADDTVTEGLKAQITERERNIEALKRQEKAIADAGGEDAYRQQQQLEQLKQIKEEKAMKAHPGLDRATAMMLQQNEDRVAETQRKTAGATAAPTQAAIVAPPTTSATPELPPSPTAQAAASPTAGVAPTSAPAAVGAATGAIPPPPAPAATPVAPRAGGPTTVTLNFNNAHNSLAQGIMDWLKNAQTEAQIASLGGVH